MAMAFAPFSWWSSSAKQKKQPSSNSVLEESDTLKFPLAKKIAPSSSRNIKRKWRSREERKIDREYDIVLVPHDGGCISGSESDDSDYSIGWLEPHGPEFRCYDESSDNNFAVLVPCYGQVGHDSVDDSKTKILGIVGNIAEMYQTGWTKNWWGAPGIGSSARPRRRLNNPVASYCCDRSPSKY